jgi:GNAT superfamily N-acetyltransferase
VSEPGPGRFCIEALAPGHRRGEFRCGVPDLDSYLRERAGQDAKRHIATTFVLVGEAPDVRGYYTLSQQIVALSDLPADVGRRLPRYPLLPATLIGRLAVDSRHQGEGVGEMLLVDALLRSWEVAQSVASYAVRVDATDEAARAFYGRYGFIPLPVDGLKLFLPMAVLDELFA